LSAPVLAPPVKYAAQIAHVREVALVGTADLAFWTDRLRGENLFPTEREGRAELLLSGTSARFMGLPFQEVVLSVFVSRQAGGADRDRVYLPQAFNSRRLFAWVERNCFSTPYHHGEIHVEVGPPASVRLAQGGRVPFRMEMAAGLESRQPTRNGPDGWEGPAFLPATGRGADNPGKWFYAKLDGMTQTYPFVPGDVAALTPSPDRPVFQWLLDSGFAGKEWVIRSDANHAKSKTYRGGWPD
jgi:hypothetical protein